MDTDSAELIGEERGLVAVRDEWRALAEARGNPFITPEWYEAALAHVDGSCGVAVVAVRTAAGSLRGLLPLVRTRSGAELRFAGARAGDRFSPAAREGDEVAVALAAAPLLDRGRLGWRRIVLDGVDAGAEWWRALSSFLTGVDPVARPASAYPYAPLSGASWDDYLGARSRGFRSQVRRKTRALERDHGMRLRRTEGADGLAADFATLLALHRARWRQRDGASSLERPGLVGLHRAFAEAALERGWLRLFVLELEGAPAAAWYGWSLGGRWSYFQAGYDPAWEARSVGFVLMAETVRAAVEEGAGEYDMLLGQESFKARFAAETRWGRSVVIVPRGPRRAAARTGVAMRQAWRRLPSRQRDRILAARARLGRRS